MFEWKIEEMALMKQKEVVDVGGIVNFEIYACEKEVSREDKIAFVDNFTRGKLSYILDMINKFKIEQDETSDRYNDINSLIEWLERNDTKYRKNTFSRDRNTGLFTLYSGQSSLCSRFIQNPYTRGINQYYNDIVDEAFRKQLIECEKQEQKFLLEHDEYCILKRQFRKNSRKYSTTFGVNIILCENERIIIKDTTGNDLQREITINELKILLEKYKELDALVARITKEINIRY